MKEKNQSSFEKVISYNDISFRYAKGKSLLHGTEFHDYYEIMYIINASGVFLSEKENTQLKPQMLIIIPKETFHNFVLRDEDKYIRCCLNFPDSAELKEITDLCMNDIYMLEMPNKDISKIFSDLISSFDDNYDDFDRRFILQSDFIRLLIELKRKTQEFIISDMRDESSFIYKILTFINNHFREDINIDRIAEEMNVSKSQLSHRFKESLNISVYKYINEKRLLYARKLIKM